MKSENSPMAMNGMERYLIHVFQVLDESGRTELGQLMLRAANSAQGSNFDAKLGRLFRVARSRGIRYEDYRPAAVHREQ